MKKIKLVILIFISILILMLLFERNCSNYDLVGKTNIENISKINTGITKKKVIDLMGEPNRIVYLPANDNSCILFYQSDNVDFKEIEVKIDKNGLVSNIYIPRN